jgi:hypothetical protein
MQMICALLVFQSSRLPQQLTTLSPWLDMHLRPIAETRQLLAAQRHRRFIKTHTPLDGLPLADDVTYIIVGRDPRDVAISMAHHCANLDDQTIRSLQHADVMAATHPQPSGVQAGFGDVVRAWLTDDSPPTLQLSSLRGMLWHLSDAWSRREAANVVLLHYEDLSENLSGEMRALADRLGISVPASVWDDLVAAATFPRMRERAEVLVPDERLGLFLDSQRFFRRGGTGQWRGFFTEADQREYAVRVATLASPELGSWLHRRAMPAAGVAAVSGQGP